MFQYKDVKYQDILEIDDVTISPDSVVVIMGPSGSGKSSFLKLSNKMVSYDVGQIRYRGRELKDWDSIKLRQEVVMLSQHPVIFPGTIEDNLRIGCKFSQRPLPNEEDLLKVLNRVRLHQSLEKSCDQLSGGEKQRVALARVLLMNPPMLLLDEPTASLDEDLEEEVIRRVIEQRKQEGLGLMMTLHSKQLARQFGERIFTIENKKLKELPYE